MTYSSLMILVLSNSAFPNYRLCELSLAWLFPALPVDPLVKRVVTWSMVDVDITTLMNELQYNLQGNYVILLTVSSRTVTQ